MTTRELSMDYEKDKVSVQALPLFGMARRKAEIPEAFRKREQKTKMSKKEWKWQRGIVAHPLSESHWNRGHSSMKKWESEKHKGWSMPAGRLQRPRGHRWLFAREGWKVVSMWLGRV